MPTKNTQPSKMQKSYNFLAMFFFIAKIAKTKVEQINENNLKQKSKSY